MICKACNTDNIPGSSFCNHCGAALEQGSADMQNITETTPVSIPDPGKVMNLVSLLLGIASMIFSASALCTCGQLDVSDYVLVFGMAITSSILGIMGFKKSKDAGFNNKQGIVGMILGIAGTVFLIAITIILVGIILAIIIQNVVFKHTLS